MSGAPDSFEPVLGWHVFTMPDSHDVVLRANRHYWVPGWSEARCTMCEPHLGRGCAPVQDHKCGLHGWHDYQKAEEYRQYRNGHVVAAVRGFGEVLFDDHFWRASQAEVITFVALEIGSKYTHFGQVALVISNWMRKVADRFGVPVLEREAAHRYALLYATPWHVPREEDDGTAQTPGTTQAQD